MRIISICLLICLVTVSCEPVDMVYDEIMGLFSDQKPQKISKKKENKPKKEEKKKTALKNNKQADSKSKDLKGVIKPEEELVKNKKESEKSTTLPEENLDKKEKTDLSQAPQTVPQEENKIAQKKEFKKAEKQEGGPVSLAFQWGGKPNFIEVFDGIIVAAFGKSVLVFEKDSLEVKTSFFTSAPANQVSFIQGEKDYLAVSEDGFILEIFEKNKEGNFELIKGFNVEAPFSGPFLIKENPRVYHLYVFLNDRLQILDCTNPQDIKVLADIAVTSADSVYPLGDTLYLKRGTSLDVVSLKSMSITASVPINVKYKILGHVDIGNRNYLVLTYKTNQTGLWNSVQLLPLTENGGVSDIGENILFKEEADEVYLDDKKPFVYLIRDQKLSIFSFDHKSVMEGKSLPFEKVFKIQGSDQLMHVFTEKGLMRVSFKVSEQAVEFAQGATSPIIGDVDGFFILSEESMLLMSRDDDKSPLKFSLIELNENGISSKKELLKLTQNDAEFEFFNYHKGALYFYTTDTGQFYRYIFEENKLEKIEFKLADVDGFVMLEWMGVDYAAIISPYKTTPHLNLYKVTPSGYQIVKRVPLKEGGPLVYLNKVHRLLSVCGVQGLCLVELDKDIKKTKLETTLTLKEEGYKAKDILLSPYGDKAFIYMEKNGNYSIALFKITPKSITEESYMAQVQMTNRQFRGISFSKGGEWLLLPQEYGLSVYDLTTLTKPKYLFRWNAGRAFHADVKNKGKSVCLALGDMGLKCAEFR